MGDLEVRVPIIQGGMGVGISLCGLASAVAREGGVGVIATAGTGFMEPDLYTDFLKANRRGLEKQIRLARAGTDGIVGVNIMVALSNFADLVETAVRERIDIIFSGAGLPMDLPKYVPPGGGGPKLVPIVSSGKAASILARQWRKRYGRLPDAFVVEGPMAGGHLGFKLEQIDDPAYALERLVPEVVEAAREFPDRAGRPIPIIAAGGVYTGADIHRLLHPIGAAGVQMATRFVATVECDASDEFKDAYLQARREDLRIIKSPVGMPGRAIENDFLRRVDRGEKVPYSCPYHCLIPCDYEHSPYCIANALFSARRGAMHQGFAFAGANAWRVDRIVTVHELVESLLDEYAAAAAEA
jgi:nitronate monooxygenase